MSSVPQSSQPTQPRINPNKPTNAISNEPNNINNFNTTNFAPPIPNSHNNNNITTEYLNQQYTHIPSNLTTAMPPYEPPFSPATSHHNTTSVNLSFYV